MYKEVLYLDLGLKRYRETEILQEELVERVIDGTSQEYILTVEHPSVITLGRSTKEDEVFIEDIDRILEKGIEIYRSKRGGSATLHEPGQLVVYPILKLEKRDVHGYVRDLEELIIELLKIYNIKAIRREKYTGVWIDDKRKICSIGIAVKKWVTYHGLALNVSNRLEDFKLFHPCGLEDVEMVSIESVLGENVDMDELKRRLLHIFSVIFERRVVNDAKTCLA
ncbi:MAG TPA: lipoyl(octanoyl) transferase LipB [bacterium]|mgnify:CR=1 FL=1|nr:lipoyl(octanoyl) transferase LipB [bacterium]